MIIIIKIIKLIILGMEQSGPDQDPEHWQRPKLQIPFPEHSVIPGHFVVGASIYGKPLLIM